MFIFDGLQRLKPGRHHVINTARHDAIAAVCMMRRPSSACSGATCNRALDLNAVELSPSDEAVRPALATVSEAHRLSLM
jgi:hypothetical protein